MSLLRGAVTALLLGALVAAQSGHEVRPSEVRFEPRFENEHASVTTLDLPPGSFARAFQNTTHDILWIALSDGDASFVRGTHDKMPAMFRAGDTRLFHSYEIASVANAGASPLRSAVVQLKQHGLTSGGCGCSGESERAVCGCPGAAHLPLLWALAAGQITLAGTRLDPGQAFARAIRREDMLLVAITAADLRDEAADNPDAATLHLASGDAAWIKAGRHQFRNTGGAAARFVTIEF